ncbi:transient receptor potential cation channel subfamily M member 7-like [Limulus polyphemus]|uniref:Transient receptor potential cation channel subfamily M member 7-like n=1 Tax=Limulus polyphemus TaxID=6850 RepID=A0ABM1BRJ4_LIMPO|nr:transient receptor potential cation channel subfamily M member 7-like [Limulus polyphemus]
MADDTPVEHVFKLMKEYWRMMDPHEPHLVISVAGGAKNFHLDGRRKERFNTGLISAAETTNAWIITGGCNFGSMKIVGEAIRERQFLLSTSERMTHAYRCIGVTKWGYIDDKEALVNVNVKEPYTARYKVNPVFKLGQPGSLNPNHTHFFLVDDGSVGSFRGIQDFKSQLEHRISAPPFGSEPGLGIPVVLLLLEGGLDALYQVLVTVRHRIPVVVCAGTGRAADILAFAYNCFTKNSE